MPNKLNLAYLNICGFVGMSDNKGNCRFCVGTTGKNTIHTGIGWQR